MTKVSTQWTQRLPQSPGPQGGGDWPPWVAQPAQRESETPLTLTWPLMQTSVTGRPEQKIYHG